MSIIPFVDIQYHSSLGRMSNIRTLKISTCKEFIALTIYCTGQLYLANLGLIGGPTVA